MQYKFGCNCLPANGRKNTSDINKTMSDVEKATSDIEKIIIELILALCNALKYKSLQRSAFVGTIL